MLPATRCIPSNCRPRDDEDNGFTTKERRNEDERRKLSCYDVFDGSCRACARCGGQAHREDKPLLNGVRFVFTVRLPTTTPAVGRRTNRPSLRSPSLTSFLRCESVASV